MSFKKIILLLSLPLLLCSCTNVIELELPEQDPKLVVNGIFTPDSTWRVEISASQSALSNDPYEQVQHANVEVFQNNKYLFNLTHTGEGIYETENTMPKALEHYTLKVSAPGFPNCEATGYAPALPTTHSVKVAMASSPNDPNIRETEVTFVLEDAPETSNYYFISAYFPDTASTGEVYKNYVSLQFQAPLEDEFNMGSRYFFSDRLINGTTTNLKLRYYWPGKGKKVYFNVSHISPDYYHYARTLEKQSYNDNFLTTPGPVYNNVHNGLGIFAGYYTNTYLIRH